MKKKDLDKKEVSRPKKPLVAKVTVKGRIEINKELCKGCGYCVEACPKSVIAISKNFNKMGYFIAEVVSPLNCIGCAACAEICPDIAITVWRSSDGKATDDDELLVAR